MNTDNDQKKEIIDVLNSFIDERNKIKRVNSFVDSIVNNKNYQEFSTSSPQASKNSESLKAINDWMKSLEKGLDVLSKNTYTIINK